MKESVAPEATLKTEPDAPVELKLLKVQAVASMPMSAAPAAPSETVVVPPATETAETVRAVFPPLNITPERVASAENVSWPAAAKVTTGWASVEPFCVGFSRQS